MNEHNNDNEEEYLLDDKGAITNPEYVKQSLEYVLDKLNLVKIGTEIKDGFKVIEDRGKIYGNGYNVVLPRFSSIFSDEELLFITTNRVDKEQFEKLINSEQLTDFDKEFSIIKDKLDKAEFEKLINLLDIKDYPTDKSKFLSLLNRYRGELFPLIKEKLSKEEFEKLIRLINQVTFIKASFREHGFTEEQKELFLSKLTEEDRKLITMPQPQVEEEIPFNNDVYLTDNKVYDPMTSN